MKKISTLFLLFALILSHVMCIVVSYAYCTLQWGGRYAGYSAPARVAFFYVIPYGIGIFICIFIAYLLRKKGK